VASRGRLSKRLLSRDGLRALTDGLGASPLVQEPRFYAAFQTVCIGCGRHAQREHPTQRGIPTYAPTTLAFSAKCAKNWRFERRSRAADDRRNDEQSAMLSAEARQTTSALCEERRRRQLPARRAREAPQEMEGVSQPATPSGPPSDQHPPGSKPQPFHKEWIGWKIPPRLAWPPQTASHILNTAATLQPRTADEQ